MAKACWPTLAVVGVLGGIFAALAPSLVQRYHLPLPAAIGIYACFVMMLLLIVAPGIRSTREWLAGRVQWAILPLLWCLPYLAYAAGTGDFHLAALARLLAVGLPLLLIYRFVPVADLRLFGWQDLVVAAWLAAVLLFHQLAGIWTVPVNLDFLGRLFLIVIAVWSWAFIRPVPNLGYEFFLSGKILGVAGRNFALFAVIAFPVGLALRFIEWNPRPTTAISFGVSFLEIFLFVALLEELFFRGFLQTLISNTLKSKRGGQFLVACLFGLFHILHAPFPNWRYVILASIAGWFYGSAFVKSGNLVASTLTHAMVDTVWRAFFTKN